LLWEGLTHYWTCLRIARAIDCALHRTPQNSMFRSDQVRSGNTDPIVVARLQPPLLSLCALHSCPCSWRPPQGEESLPLHPSSLPFPRLWLAPPSLSARRRWPCSPNRRFSSPPAAVASAAAPIPRGCTSSSYGVPLRPCSRSSQPPRITAFFELMPTIWIRCPALLAPSPNAAQDSCSTFAMSSQPRRARLQQALTVYCAAVVDVCNTSRPWIGENGGEERDKYLLGPRAQSCYLPNIANLLPNITL
jgi:hypothetical protein